MAGRNAAGTTDPDAVERLEVVRNAAGDAEATEATEAAERLEAGRGLDAMTVILVAGERRGLIRLKSICLLMRARWFGERTTGVQFLGGIYPT